MKIVTQSEGIFTEPAVVENVDSVLIQTDDGVTVTVAMDMEGKVWIRKADEKGFAGMLESLGFEKRDIPPVETVDLRGATG